MSRRSARKSKVVDLATAQESPPSWAASVLLSPPTSAAPPSTASSSETGQKNTRPSRRSPRLSAAAAAALISSPTLSSTSSSQNESRRRTRKRQLFPDDDCPASSRSSSRQSKSGRSSTRRRSSGLSGGSARKRKDPVSSGSYAEIENYPSRPVIPEHVADQLASIAETALQNPKFRRWCVYEWFYCNIDGSFFSQNEFVDCLEELGLGQVTSLPVRDWRAVRHFLGKPRRFSSAFLSQERSKLHRCRSNIRLVRDGKPPKVESPADLVLIKKIPAPLQNHIQVWFLDPVSHEMATGEVVARKSGWYTLLLPTRATIVVADDAIMPHSVSTVVIPTNSGEAGAAFKLQPLAACANTRLPVGSTATTVYPYSPMVPTTPQQRKPTPVIDTTANDHTLSTIWLLLKLLTRKERLLGALESLNDEAERNRNADSVASLSTQFQQQYAWVILKISETDRSLEDALLNLKRLRASPT